MLIYEDDNPLCRIVDGSPGDGARSGMPLAAALERCPGATAIAANMKLYQRQWAAVIGRLKSIAVGVEETNLGCVYTTMPDTNNRFGNDDAALTATLMRAVPLDWLPSAGVAGGKFPAWCAAADARPGHAIRVPDDDTALARFMAPRSVNHLPLSVRQLAALHDANIHTMGQAAAAPSQTLRATVGSDARLLSELARGIDHRRVGLQTVPAMETYPPVAVG